MEKQYTIDPVDGRMRSRSPSLSDSEPETGNPMEDYLSTPPSPVGHSNTEVMETVFPQRNYLNSSVPNNENNSESGDTQPYQKYSTEDSDHLTSSEVDTSSQGKEDPKMSMLHLPFKKYLYESSKLSKMSQQAAQEEDEAAQEKEHESDAEEHPNQDNSESQVHEGGAGSYGKVPNTSGIAIQLASAKSKKDICEILLRRLNLNLRNPKSKPPESSYDWSMAELWSDDGEYTDAKSHSAYGSKTDKKRQKKKRKIGRKVTPVKTPVVESKVLPVNSNIPLDVADVLPDVKKLKKGKKAKKKKPRKTSGYLFDKLSDKSSDVRLGSLVFDTDTLYGLLIEEVSPTEYLCKNCKSVLSTKEDAVSHMEVHHPFKCAVCSQTFSTVGDLREHRRTIHKEIQYCNQCTFSTPMITRLERHIKEEHAPRESPMSKFESCICYICGETFTVWDSVDKHMEEVHGIKNITREGAFRCPICDNASGTMTAFRTHMMKHAGLFKYCPYEGCTFKSVVQRQVSKHYDQVHLGKRDFPCPFEGCAMMAKKKSELEIHLNVAHYKIRNFKCEFCGKGFMAKKHLGVHLRIHSDDKPVACQFCDYRCRQQSALNWHMKKHHPEVVEEKRKANYETTPGVPAYRHSFKPGRKGGGKERKSPTRQTKPRNLSSTEPKPVASSTVTTNMGNPDCVYGSSYMPYTAGQAADSRFIAQELQVWRQTNPASGVGWPGPSYYHY